MYELFTFCVDPMNARKIWCKFSEIRQFRTKQNRRQIRKYAEVKFHPHLLKDLTTKKAVFSEGVFFFWQQPKETKKRRSSVWIIHPLMTTTCVLIAVYLCLIFDCLIIAYCWTGIPTGELREFHKNYNETETET